MAVSAEISMGWVARLPAVRSLDRRTLLLIAGFAIATAVLRLPSFFEPPWHTDEGIFQAVAQRVAVGGRLYADAWESKPPLFIYTYVAILKVFGAGVLPLRVAAAVAALITELAVFAMAKRYVGRRLALFAASLLAVFLAVPFWEGTLALTETFAQVPTSLGLLFALNAIDRKGRASTLGLAAAGACFGAAVLMRQTTGLVALGFIVWLLLSGRREWLTAGGLLALGGSLVVMPVVLAFAAFGSWYWFWDANVGFFFNYVPSGHQLPFHYRPLIVLPVMMTVAALAIHRQRGETPRWGLPALWLTLTLAGALLTGRPYSHYFLQIFPPLVILIALMLANVRFGWRPFRSRIPAIAVATTLAALWLGVVRPEFDGNLLAMRFSKAEDYYLNFAAYALGSKDQGAYDDYFDRRVRLTQRLDETLKRLGAQGSDLYIWGEYPWVYPLTDTRPATRYMTSFYTLLIPYLDTQLGSTLAAADPRFIVVLNDVWPKYDDDTGVLQRRYAISTRAVNALLAERYELVAAVGRAQVFERTLERPLVGPREETPLVETETEDRDEGATMEEVATQRQGLSDPARPR